ncbi:MAG: signal peptidase II [Gemmatimonadetes bacterium]|nr:signal peptidase II [Gemmatimonadota bacterium]
MRSSGGKQQLFWALGGSVVLLDVFTKILAVANLSRIPRPVLGDWLTLQLVYNPGAAFGINVGQYSRWVFFGLAVIALVVLGSMVRHTKPTDRLRLTALALVCGGAVGNLIDRVRSARGVIDFIDVGIGVHRWPTFNVADMAVTVGAVVLAIVLWIEGRDAAGTVAEPSGAAEIAP